MVFESIVADILNRYLGDYVENLDRKQLKIGIWGGKLTIFLFWFRVENFLAIPKSREKKSIFHYVHVKFLFCVHYSWSFVFSDPLIYSVVCEWHWTE